MPDLQRRDVHGLQDSVCHLQQLLYWSDWKELAISRLDDHRRAVRQADFNSSAWAEHAWLDM